MVRRDRTRDRDFVAKAAALLIDQDFGLVGTFDAWPQADETPSEDKPVTVELKGAGLGVPLDRWVKKGDVFAVVQMPRGDAGPGRPVPAPCCRSRRRRPTATSLPLPRLPPLSSRRATAGAATAASGSARFRRRCGCGCSRPCPTAAAAR